MQTALCRRVNASMNLDQNCGIGHARKSEITECHINRGKDFYRRGEQRSAERVVVN
jgi:hypothetical protein